MPERLKIHEINKLAGRTVFFDANVFLDIIWPTSRHQNAILYSRFYGNCIHQNIPIAIDFVVLSEVINRPFRLEYDKHLKIKSLSQDMLPFKQYRDSPDGRQTQTDIYDIVKKNLKFFTVCGQAYSKEDVLSFMTVDNLDFNDKGIVSLCSGKGFVLATNDHDFSGQDIAIISANQNIA